LYRLTNWLQANDATIDFFGLPVPWLAFLVLYEATAVGFLFVASVRKMRSERAHAYSKPLSLACMATITVLTLGALWTTARGLDFTVVGVLYGLAFAAVVLIAPITPDRREYIKGLLRAEMLGRRRPSPWSDAGTNRLAVVLLCTLVFAGATITWEVIEG